MTFSPYGNTNSLGIPNSTAGFMEVIGGGKPTDYGDEQHLADQDEANVQQDIDQEQDEIQEDYDVDVFEPEPEAIDAISGWPTFLINTDGTYNNNVFKADAIKPKSLFGIPYNRPVRNDSVPETKPRWLKIHENYYKDGSPAYENTWTGEISDTYEGLHLVGDGVLSSIEENFTKYWTWIDEQEWGPAFKENLAKTGVTIDKLTTPMIQEINNKPWAYPGLYSVLKGLEGIDAAFTYGGNTINHFFPVNSHYAKGGLELAEFIATLGGGSAKKITKLDDIKWLNKFNRFATELPNGRWLTADGIEFSSKDAAKMYFAVQNSGGVSKTRDAVKYLNNENIRFSKKVPGFSVSSAFSSPTKVEQLKEFVTSARAHRKNRLNVKGKRDLMKGFRFNGKPYILDEQGRKWILQRASDAKRKLKFDDLSHSAHYRLVPLDHVEQVIARRTIPGSGKELEKLRTELRKYMKGLRKTNPDEYYNRIMTYGDYPYIEHRVAKGLDWFWDGDWRKTANVDWAGPTRGNKRNLRMLFSDPYRITKDKVEDVLKNYQKVGYNENPGKWLVLDIADPLNGRAISKRTNPGDLLIRRASGGEVIGRISDIYAELYSDEFAKIFKDHGSSFSNKPSYDVNFQRKTFANGKLETLSQYRKRILSERIKFIVQEADNGNNLTLQGTINPLKIKQAKINDINAFYSAISTVGEDGLRVPLLNVPTHIDEFMGKNWYLHIDRR